MSNDDHNKMVGFMFVYEHDNKLYKSLSDIKVPNNTKIYIHPVYYAGYDNNMNSEIVKYSDEVKKFQTKNKDGSWLDIIYKSPDMIIDVNVDEVIYYDDRYYHCDDDLLDYLTNGNYYVISLS